MSHTPKPPELIETDRLILRARSTDHAEESFALIDRNRSHLKPWFPWESTTLGVADAKGYIELTKKWWETGSTFDFSVFEKSSGKLIGSFGLHTINWEHRRCEIGYWISHDKQGMGYVSECLRAGEHIAGKLGFHRLGLTCDPQNKKSIAVAKRNGYRHEGTLIDNLSLHGKLRDTMQFAKLLNPAIEGQFTDNLPEGFSIKECDVDEFWKYLDNKIGEVFGDEDITFVPREHYSEEEKEKLKALSYKNNFNLRIVLLYNGKLAGWSWGYQDCQDSYYMQNSAILAEHRGRGLYTAMLDVVMAKVINKGFQKIWGRHSTLNNAILIPKLKRGFQVTGTELSDKFGSLIHLTYYPSKTRQGVLNFRAGARPDDKTKSVLKI
jgi:RimJ/RimL family protein N-acetyltransferase